MTNQHTARSTREKAAQLRAEAARVEARRRTTIVTVLVAVVVAALVGGVALVRSLSHQRAVAAASSPSGVPHNLLADGGIASDLSISPAAGAKRVRVDLYEDFQCPVCRAFEAANGQTLKSWQKAGTIWVVYHPVAFLDRASTTNYSSRAANAAAAVVDTAPSSFQGFHDLLYANQPAEGSAGLTNQQLIDYAVQAGAPRAAVTTMVQGDTYSAWVVQQTDVFSQKFTGTPTIVIDGTQLQGLDRASLTAALTQAAHAKGLRPPA